MPNDDAYLRPLRHVEVLCLKCRRVFLSYDRRRNRICPTCDKVNRDVTRQSGRIEFDHTPQPSRKDER